jgi:signal transduction histidine kinase
MHVRSLSLKVALPLAAVMTLVSITIAAVGADYRLKILTESARQRARMLISVAVGSLNAATPEGHRPAVQPFLDRLGRDPEVLAVRIVRMDGVVARSTKASEVGTRLPPEVLQRLHGPVAIENQDRSGGRTYIHATHRIPNDESCQACHDGAAHLGYMDVDLSVSGPGTELGHWRRVNILTGGLQVVALLGLTTLVTAVLVVRPLRRLSKAMDRMKTGDLTVHVQPVGTREIDSLIDGFNTMVDRLREATGNEREAHRRRMERAEHLAAVGEMAAGVAHEIRNPVAGVKAAVEVLARQMPHDDERRSVLKESVVELNRIEGVIRDLLSYARPRLPEQVTTDLNQVVRDGVMLTTPKAASQGITLQCNLAHGLPPVRVDPLMVRQVVANLVLNAVQILEPGGGRIEVSTSLDARSVHCRVRDSGPGVPVSEAESIFKPFFTTKARGTGLGLPISCRLIELQGGHLRLENPGQPGASFVFSIPAGPPAATPGERPS